MNCCDAPRMYWPFGLVLLFYWWSIHIIEGEFDFTVLVVLLFGSCLALAIRTRIALSCFTVVTSRTGISGLRGRSNSKYKKFHRTSWVNRKRKKLRALCSNRFKNYAESMFLMIHNLI